MPGTKPRKAGDRLAASYINFFIANGGVVMPAFGGEAAEADARCARAPERGGRPWRALWGAGADAFLRPAAGARLARSLRDVSHGLQPVCRHAHPAAARCKAGCVLLDSRRARLMHTYRGRDCNPGHQVLDVSEAVCCQQV